ncbi:hypothetical protein H0H81_000974 [Sphagnurus paluster]|uniref:Uncharacterized protein n=1 Tax=Sphagnurus paluster TaxID=117069 RepID=A0A9P7GUU7_9AGAR|nr:hypothetical protein H0H81_000974 [Sphagnurus paluster]
MLFSNTRKFTLTLFIYTAIVLTLAASSNAHIQQRDHANIKRLIKKRSPFPQDIVLPPVAGAGAAVPSFSSSSATDSAPTAAPSQSSTSQPSSSSSSSSSSESLTQSSLTSESSSASESSSSSVSESSKTSESSQSTSSTASSASPAAPTSEPINVIGAPDPTKAVAPPSTSTRTESVDAIETGTDTAPPQVGSNAAKSESTTMTVIIIVASSVAGVAILWTVFRKWKLGRSSKFDERLQPIDWQPTNPDDGALPGSHRRLSGASSFRSGSGHHNAARGYSDHGHEPYAIPDHDFTAGPSTTLAPVGGYADLARGPSPQPQMNQMSRGPSLTRPGYDVGVPLHHQAGYNTQEAYSYSGSRGY